MVIIDRGWSISYGRIVELTVGCDGKKGPALQCFLPVNDFFVMRDKRDKRDKWPDLTGLHHLLALFALFATLFLSRLVAWLPTVACVLHHSLYSILCMVSHHCLRFALPPPSSVCLLLKNASMLCCSSSNLELPSLPLIRFIPFK